MVIRPFGVEYQPDDTRPDCQWTDKNEGLRMVDCRLVNSEPLDVIRYECVVLIYIYR